jgi:hypothetical protein
MLLAVVLLVQEDFPIGRGVGSRCPVRVLLLMALPTLFSHTQNVGGLQPHLFGHFTTQVSNQADACSSD